MNLCNNDHDEVCYEGNICPMCDLKKDYEDQIEDLQQQLKESEEKNE